MFKFGRTIPLLNQLRITEKTGPGADSGRHEISIIKIRNNTNLLFSFTQKKSSEGAEMLAAAVEGGRRNAPHVKPDSCNPKV